MRRFLKRKASSSSGSGDIEESSTGNVSDYISQPSPISSIPFEVDLSDLPWDPADRKRISEYHPNQRDEVRRRYLMRGPFQPRGYSFPKRMIGNKERRFCPAWFYKYSNWLEYSVKVDRAFCLCCYVFRDQHGKQGGSDSFVTEGFNGWNKTERLGSHVGDVGSFHNRALRKCEDLMRQNQSIVVAFNKQSDGARIGENARYQMVGPSVQQDISHEEFDEQDDLNCLSQETFKPVFEEIGDDVFGLLVDESRDISKKGQIVVVLRYVDTSGIVRERFAGLAHVMEKSAQSLKSVIEALLADNGLSLKRIRSQGYNGATNMRGEFSGLKALIMRENSSAHYVHCFAHQLELVVVQVAKEHFGIGNFFDMLSVLMNVLCASCKKDIVQESNKEKVREVISCKIENGDGLNEELSIIRTGTPHSGHHYRTLLHLVDLFPSVVDVLEYYEKEGDNSLSQRQANGLHIYFKSFAFVFYLHLMLHILGLTDLLSQSLLRKDQDILNTISLVKSTKRLLEKFKVDGFDSLLIKISSFCEKHDIEMLNLKEDYINPKNRRQKTNITHGHYYEFDCFYVVVDRQIREFGDRFSETSSELLTCMSALSPCDSFREFDRSKLLRLSELYPGDFSSVERMTLEHQLDLYIDNVKEDERFANLNGIADLSRVMVETRKHLSHPLVYRLLKLALVLPIANAILEN
uniref:uncharacterized protein LOC122603755 n=1 Tax=Erigeron canadensis TaxID=72917 RepID=UPI001CB95A71|nr:uncharacterized protein LOC122603755 [Erigeron canadensis]